MMSNLYLSSKELHADTLGLSFLQYGQFSLTVTDAALEHQRDMRDGLRAFANLLASSAPATNSSWPRFFLQDFEVHAGDFRARTGVEMLAIGNVVQESEREEYLDWVTGNYEKWIGDAHLFRYGNTSLLSPEEYYPFFHMQSNRSDEFGERLPVPIAEEYIPYIGFSPPLVKYTLVVG